MTKINKYRSGKCTTIRRFFFLVFLTMVLAGIYGERSIAAETLDCRVSCMDNFEHKPGLGASWFNFRLIPRSLVSFDGNPLFLSPGISYDNLNPELDDHRRHSFFATLGVVEADPHWESTSIQFTLRPARNWMMRFSRGWLIEPKGLLPSINIEQTSFSTLHRVRTKNTKWSSIFKWERNNSNPGKIFDTVLIQSQFTVGKVHTLFGRIKHAPLNRSLLGTNRTADPAFAGHQLKLGYHHEFPKTGSTTYRVGTTIALNGASPEYNSLYHKGRYSVFTFLNIQFD